MRKEVILLLADTHFPYHHIDVFNFYESVKKKYKPQQVFHLGDMVDNHAISYHESSPELQGASDELDYAITCVEELGKIFPKMTILTGNHDKLPIRKARTAGLPSRYIKNNKEVFNMPNGWEWKIEEKITMIDGRTLWMKHNLTKNVLEIAKYYNCCFACGHYHEAMTIESLQDYKYNVWGAICGCGVDDESLAFEYNKGNLKRPMLGCIVVENGIPTLIRMKLDENKNWIGELQ